jgi:hypothetical protein
VLGDVGFDLVAAHPTHFVEQLLGLFGQMPSQLLEREEGDISAFEPFGNGWAVPGEP